MTMHILVCAKQVLDPDGVNSYALWGRLEVDATGRGFETGGAIPHIINAYDEQAVEVALRLRDAGLDCTTTVAVVGGEDAAAILRRCVAMGADRAIHVHTGAANTDGFSTAAILAGLVTELADVQLVICGRQGSDYDQGAVPAALAERLDWSFVAMAAGIAIEDPRAGAARVTRVTALGPEVVEAELPAVVTVSNEAGQPRYPSSRRMMAARRTPPDTMDASALADTSTPPLELAALEVPAVQGQCELIEGETPAAKAAALLERLEAMGAIDG